MWLMLLPLLLGGQAGCLHTDNRPHTSFLRRMQNQAITPDQALIEVALIEQPPGNEYINRELWRHTDEMIVDLEHRAKLEDNGFRMGQLVGASPAELQRLLLSERFTKTNVLAFHPGNVQTIHVMPADVARASYQFADGKKNEAITLDDARFALDVMARFAPDGRTTFTFTPKAEHGAQAFPFRADPNGWVMTLERQSRAHPELSWEVTLGPNQMLLIGGRLERDGSLGQAAFVQQDGVNAVQRVLAIRNVRTMDAREVYESNVERRNGMPLALQAMMPAVRR